MMLPHSITTNVKNDPMIQGYPRDQAPINYTDMNVYYPTIG